MGSGGTICVDTVAGFRLSKESTSRSNSSGSSKSNEVALYAPTAPENLPTKFSVASCTCNICEPHLFTYCAIANPKVIGSACCPCVRPICNVSFSLSAKFSHARSSRIISGIITFFTASLYLSAFAVSTTS